MATKHGMRKSPLYQTWTGMKDRCNNPNGKDYSHYGGRGIKVCDRWLESFENFYEDMGDKPSKNHSLDRIDNDGDYSPENCRWVKHKTQNRNRRGLTLIYYEGKSQCLAAWCEELCLNYQTMYSRIYGRGWEPSKAFTTEVAKFSGRPFHES